jgi:hypothetical protein
VRTQASLQRSRLPFVRELMAHVTNRRLYAKDVKVSVFEPSTPSLL